jgi:hypothetical protein
VITAICAAVMLLFSRGAKSGAMQRSPLLKTSGESVMTRLERRKYLGFLGFVLLCWSAVIVIFSSWGLAGH